MKKLVFALTMSICGSAFAAEPELKPAQEEAKASFDESLEDPLKAMNESCGTKIVLKTDFQNFKSEEWNGKGVYSWCQNVVQTIGGMCKDRPAYKKALTKKLTGISCVFAGAKPAQKKDGTNDGTLRNMSFDKGVFTFNMFPDATNISDNTKAVIEKALN